MMSSCQNGRRMARAAYEAEKAARGAEPPEKLPRAIQMQKEHVHKKRSSMKITKKALKRLVKEQLSRV